MAAIDQSGEPEVECMIDRLIRKYDDDRHSAFSESEVKSLLREHIACVSRGDTGDSKYPLSSLDAEPELNDLSTTVPGLRLLIMLPGEEARLPDGLFDGC